MRAASNRPDTCLHATGGHQQQRFLLARWGPFSNRASFVNAFSLLSVALPGSRFSPRSACAAATSGPKHRRCNVHNGLACNARGPTASLAAGLHPRPGGQLAPAPSCRASESRPDSVRRPLAALTSGMARPNARCCAGSRPASWRVRCAPCQHRTVSQWTEPSSSGLRLA